MAKYIINEGYGNRVNVEGATSVKHIDGFFYFTDAANKAVYIAQSAGVLHIKRVDGQ